MGRQPIGDAARANMVSLRMNDQEKAELDAEARRRGFRDRAAFIRQLLKESKSHK